MREDEAPLLGVEEGDASRESTKMVAPTGTHQPESDSTKYRPLNVQGTQMGKLCVTLSRQNAVQQDRAGGSWMGIRTETDT